MKSVCVNHHGISLLSIAGKILARLIFNRIIKHLVDCGFQLGRGTIDTIFSLRQVAEKVRAKTQELYIVFVDLTKAFDTVNRNALSASSKETWRPKKHAEGNHLFPRRNES